MSALRLCLVAIAATLVLVAPAAAQRPERMSPGLVSDLSDAEVQRALIAAGSLDAVAGRASRGQLRAAIERFRKAYRFKDGFAPLTKDERQKLQEIGKKFQEWTRLEKRLYQDPASKNGVWLRLPLRLVGDSHSRSLGKQDTEWFEYRAADNSVSIGPEIHALSKYTPISLFKERIMGASLNYKHLHLTSEEFAVQGDAGDETNGYFSYNLVLTYGDRLKGLFMRYAKRAPNGFTVPDFLLPILEAESNASDSPRPDPANRGWQLLMQGITNLAASDFPFDNGWQPVSSKTCPVSKNEGNGQPKTLRILFGTDRAMKPGAAMAGRVANPDALFGNEPSGRLHLGCAYVSPPAAGSDASKLAVDYQLFHKSEKGDFGDHIYLTDEIGDGSDGRTAWAGGDALVFIHGYNVAFKDALSTVAQIVSATGYEGRVYMYSWPSAYSTLGYFQDVDNAEQAEPYFHSFMRVLMRDANINEIDLLAHSMGSHSLLRAVSALRPIFETERGGGKFRRSIRIGQMIFAAPDVAVSVFDQKIVRIAPYADRVTVYVSSNDTALSLSGLLRSGMPRMGDLRDGEPALIDNSKVHIIDATGRKRWYQSLFSGGYGHDYFSQAKAVLDDIQDILKARRAKDRSTPDERASTRFEKMSYKAANDKFYWRLKEK